MTGPGSDYISTVMISISYLVWGVLTIGAAIYRSILAWRDRYEVDQYRKFYLSEPGEVKCKFFWPEEINPEGD